MTLRSRFVFIVLLAALASFALPAHAQYSSVTVTKLKAGDGSPLAAGTMCWLGTNNAGQPIGYRAGTDTQSITTPICRDVVNGATTSTYKGVSKGALQVADTTLTTPVNVCYKVSVVDSSTGKVVLGSYAGQTSGYDCVQPSGATWSFDTYTPTGTPNVVHVAGPTGPQGAPGLTFNASNDIPFTGNDTIDKLNGSTLRGQNYHAWGDSITFGSNASTSANRYVNLVAAARGWILTNHGVAGDQLPDLASHMYTYTPVAGDVDSILIGQNDTCGEGDTAGSPKWVNLLEASQVYLMTPTKLNGQDAAVTKTGTWTNSSQSPMGVQSSTNGDSLSFTTSGTTIYIAMHAVLSNTNSVSVTVDGGNYGTITPVFTQAPGAHLNHAPYLIRIANLPNKPHTVTLTTVITSGAVYFDWATNNLQGKNALFQLNPYRTALTGTSLNACRAAVAKAVREMTADGMPIFPVDTQGTCDSIQGVSQCNTSDGTHPTDAGHAILANAVLKAMDNFSWHHPSPKVADESGTWMQRTDPTTTGQGAAYYQEFLVNYRITGNSSVKVTLQLSPDSNLDGSPKSFAFTADLSAEWANRFMARYIAAGNVTNAPSTGSISRIYKTGTEGLVLGELSPIDNTTLQFTLANITGNAQRGTLKIRAYANDDFSIRSVTLGSEYTTTLSAATPLPLDATTLNGQVPSANLGSGTANSTKFLRGDLSWATAPSSTPAILSGWCGGVAASSSTILIYQLGTVTSTNCTQTAYSHQASKLIPTAGTLQNLFVSASTAGVGGTGSGVFTVYINNVATSITCTVGTGTGCSDTTHTAAVTAGQFVAVKFTTAASETLANVAVSLEKQ